ncbi:transposase [Salmonella enterica subsp. enterica serovar Typhimurium]|nr:transposase [Salmonella enterica subsp. enterica serovar Typhimurium]ELQ9624186.1 transposase [Salmonella enterica]MBZ4900325.1 transposase [Salmonella enterica subsp. enterica serovar Typhimurium]
MMKSESGWTTSRRSFLVKRYVRPQYGCQRMVSGNLPEQIIPKGIPEPGLVAQVLVSKFSDRQLLYHQRQVFARAGVELPVSTQAGCVGAACVRLIPLAELLHAELLKSPVLHADENPPQILETKKAGSCRTATCGRMSAAKPRATESSASTASPDGRRVTPSMVEGLERYTCHGRLCGVPEPEERQQYHQRGLLGARAARLRGSV